MIYMYIDVHCHIESYEDIKEVIERAKSAGVGVIINNSVDLKSMKKTLALSEWFSSVKVALGIYPIEALKLNDSEIEDVIIFIRKNKDKIIAIGEVGIDLKHSSDFENQKKHFLKFVELSKELDFPIIVHSRKAEEEVIEILEREKCDKVIMHCFTGNLSLVERIARNGWMLSIPTNIVFNEVIQNTAKKVPIQNLLCETDSPYFNPFHEKRNEPCFVVESYKKISEIKGMELAEVEEQIEENFNRVFGINV
jgi:TatD DNase family protein